jgi:hypothetical protein
MSHAVIGFDLVAEQSLDSITISLHQTESAST